ncbi:hypothetical protein Lalb_Chr08g0233501 [Lupinus albus]|uniref:Late nodulin n=1 Tax=Lupinus albus TaxID=3870 RepID=A0A6A4Q3T3_LUPAL|nr:hypothetical protein Lalb_Chr08g0233501 [Lupinus albus]
MRMSIVKVAFVLVFIFTSDMCKDSEARGPIVHYPCHSDKECQIAVGPGYKCVGTNCVPPQQFEKIHIQASKE